MLLIGGEILVVIPGLLPTRFSIFLAAFVVGIVLGRDQVQGAGSLCEVRPYQFRPKVKNRPYLKVTCAKAGREGTQNRFCRRGDLEGAVPRTCRFAGILFAATLALVLRLVGSTLSAIRFARLVWFAGSIRRGSIRYVGVGDFPIGPIILVSHSPVLFVVSWRRILASHRVARFLSDSLTFYLPRPPLCGFLAS